MKFIAVLLLALVCIAPQIEARSLNGFDLDDASVPPEKILRGGPPRDGIPALDAPEFAPADASGLAASTHVLGLSHQGVARAYPIGILNWHEIVNDRFGDAPIAVTFCPLCGSGIAFIARIDGEPLSFGVSGLLYQSDLLMYDRNSESLFSQIGGEAITGKQKGKKLATIAVTHTTLGAWLERHPQSLVLQKPREYRRDYERDPYLGYAQRPDTYFPVEFRARGLHPKERVLGHVINGEARAWPFIALRRVDSPLADQLGGETVRVFYDEESDTARLENEQGEQLAATTLFWFAWSAFHPDTSLFSTK